AAGLAGTKAMEQVASRLMALESEADQQREQAVGPGPPFVLAARNLAQRVLGVDPDEDQQSKAGMILHYGAGLAWAPLYQQLRRRTGMGPVAAGLATGASQSLLLDEVVTPAIGASAPNRDYPVSTHLRGLAAHLAYGLAIAAVTEFVWKATGAVTR
ncbi:MAG TPA: hypothetical protein VM324_02650, partial [Egibacteraceae bacterium]|nr:hypothetical protein [Egibacteraceae bacterium]